MQSKNRIFILGTQSTVSATSRGWEVGSWRTGWAWQMHGPNGFDVQNCAQNQIQLMLSTRIKDAGIAIRHSQGRILFYIASSTNELEGVVALCDNKLALKKTMICYRKICWTRQTGWKKHPGSAGIDNEGPWACNKKTYGGFCSKWFNSDPKSLKSGFALFRCL